MHASARDPTAPRATWRALFRVSLRALMVLVLIVGGLLGWQARRASIQRHAVARIKALSGTVVYDYELDSADNYRPQPQPWAPFWLRRVTGDEFLQGIAGFTLSAPPGQTLTVDAATVEAVAALNRLSTMTFWNTTLTDEQLARVLSRSRPRHLYLTNNQVTPAALATIPGFQDVEDLAIEFGHRVPGSACLPALARFTRLKKLGIARVDLAGPDALTDLRSLTGLESLSIDRSPEDEVCLSQIQGLTALKFLRLAQTHVTDAGLARLSGLTQLETLNVDGSGLTDAGLAVVATWPRLKALHLRENDSRFIEFNVPHGQLTDASLIALSRCPGIIELHLPGRRFTDVGLTALGTMPGLIRLDLDAVEATPAGVQALLATRQFKFLVLLGPSVADDWVPLFANQKRLTWLGLISPKITDAGMTAVSALTGLRVLDVAGSSITDAGLATLARSTARWRVVFAFRSGVTQAGVDAFLAARPGTQLIWEAPQPEE